jgi:hypothetical protein
MSYHGYFNASKTLVTSWTSVAYFTADRFDKGAIYLVSGGVDFL